MIAMGLVTALVLGRTFIGRSMYAIGGNEEAARLSGLRVKRQKIVIYALSGLFAAVAGIVLASRLVSAQPQAAQGYELDAIAAVVIGGASLAGGVGKASGTLIGALILAVLRNGLNLLSVSAFWQQVVIGVVIALAVLLDTLRRKAGSGAASSAGAAPGAPGSGRRNALKFGGAGALRGDRRRRGLAPQLRFVRRHDEGRHVVVHAQQPLLRPDEGGRAGGGGEGGSRPHRHRRAERRLPAGQPASELTSSGVSSIIVNPVDSDAVGPGVRSANKADIPWSPRTAASTRRRPPRSSPPTTWRRQGSPPTRWPTSSAQGSIVILQGTAGTSASRERGAGFAEGIKAYPGIKVVAKQPADFDRTKGLDVMTNLIQSHPGVTGVFAENDEMALGAVKALGSKAARPSRSSASTAPRTG